MSLLEGGGIDETREERCSSGREMGGSKQRGAVCAEAGSMRATVHSGTTETRNVGGAGSWQGDESGNRGVGSSRGKAGACSEARLTGFLLAAVEEGGSKESGCSGVLAEPWVAPGKTGALICITTNPLRGQTPGRARQ